MTPLKKLLKGLAVAFFWILIWALLALLVDRELLLPGPLAVLRRLFALLGTPDFPRTVGVTLLRILCGAAAGVVLGAVLAVLTSRFRLLDALLSPLLTLVKATPVASFIILLLIWVGRDILPAVIAALMVLPVMWANLSAGIASADPLLLEMGKVFRFPVGRRLRRIWVPTLLPHFLAACRSALGLGWKAGVAAEVLTVPARSIGRRLYESKLNLETADLFAWTLTVILCSLIIEKLLSAGIGLLARRQKGGRP